MCSYFNKTVEVHGIWTVFSSIIYSTHNVFIHRCGGDGDDNSYFSSNTMKDALIYSVGSLPTQNIADWVNNDFVPVPIGFKLKTLDQIFKPKWEDWNQHSNADDIPVDPDNPDGEKLNGTRIKAFFFNKQLHYCKIILGWEDCSLYEFTGCGLSSECPENTRCETDESKPDGQVCVNCGCNTIGSKLPPAMSCYYHKGIV